MAGFSKMSLVGEMHAFRATDPREKDIAEGHNPIQVCEEGGAGPRSLCLLVVLQLTVHVHVQIILDQAAHLMDAVALGTSCLSIFLPIMALFFAHCVPHGADADPPQEATPAAGTRLGQRSPSATETAATQTWRPSSKALNLC